MTAALAAAGLAWACSSGEAPGSRSLHELERMAFVPAGVVELTFLAAPDNRWVFEQPLLFDRYELTRADWLHHTGDAPGAKDTQWSSSDASWDAEHASWPAYMNQEEARELCTLRGMRLPTAREWLYAAMGPLAHKHPWGSDQESVANTMDLGLQRPAPVGTFESGQSPFGLYDAVGNVWEWVSDRVPGYGEGPGEAMGAGGSQEFVSALGGSWLSSKTVLYERQVEPDGAWMEYLALTLDVRHRAPAVGMRSCAEAGDWLREHASRLARGEDAEGRLEALGKRWARTQPSARAFLHELAQAEPEQRALAWLSRGAGPP